MTGVQTCALPIFEAVELGRAYALEHFDCPLPIKVRHTDAAKGKTMVTGNEAGGLGAVYAGAAETKDIRFPFKNAEPVVFSHEFHLGKYNNNCKVCHNAIFDIRKQRHYTMKEMEKTKSCGACHTGVKAFGVADEAS